MLRDMSFTEAVAKIDALKAIGETRVHFFRDHHENIPWDRITKIEEGGGWRLSGPSGCCLIAEIDGIEFSWSIDFERPEANGKPYAMFDEARLRDVAMRLPPPVRKEFGRFLSEKVMHALHVRTSEVRELLAKQWASEDLVRGLIAFAEDAPC